jgi:tetratricopeptide (TPR) repeat protein
LLVPGFLPCEKSLRPTPQAEKEFVMDWRRCLIGVLLGCVLALGIGITAIAQDDEGETAAEEAAAVEEHPEEAAPSDAVPGETTGEQTRAADAPPEPPGQPAEGLALTPYPYKVIVAGDAVNIRRGPSTKASIIGRVVRNDLLEVLGETEGWLHVVVPSGVVGYIYGKLTAKPPSPVPADVEAAVQEHLREGNLHYYREDFDGAIDEYRAALDAWPDGAEAHYNLASAYVEKGWYEEAINEYAEALGLEPDHVYSLYNLGWVYFQQAKYQEAVAQWERVAKMHPWFLDALYNLALTYEMLGDSRTGQAWQRFIEAAEQTSELEEVVEQVRGHLAALPAE